MKNPSSGALLFRISENLLEFRPFKTSCKLSYFEKNQLCACLILHVPNLHTAPKRQLKLEIFLGKSILIWKNINLQDVLKGLDSTKFLEILHSNKTPNKFLNHQLKFV